MQELKNHALNQPLIRFLRKIETEIAARRVAVEAVTAAKVSRINVVERTTSEAVVEATNVSLISAVKVVADVEKYEEMEKEKADEVVPTNSQRTSEEDVIVIKEETVAIVVTDEEVTVEAVAALLVEVTVTTTNVMS